MITVYTVILNDHDNLRPPHAIEPGVDYVCFSDEYHECPPWRIVPAPRAYGNPSRDSRIPKILSHLFFNSEFTIYHDATLQMCKPPSALISDDLRDADLALYRHPCRKTVYEEADICRSEQIGYDDRMTEQIARYAAHAFQMGLYAGGVLIRRNTEAVQQFNLNWWDEFRRGSSRDQIALPFAICTSRVRISVIDADVMTDSRFEMTWHADWQNHKDNGDFEPARQLRIERRRRLADLCR